MYVARESGRNRLVTGLVPQSDFLRLKESVHELLQELDRSPRGTTIEAEFESIRDGFADVQRRRSMIEEKFDEKVKTILPELEKMTELVKELSQKRPSN
jgi:predicted nuclease with TOPRIM domain